MATKTFEELKQLAIQIRDEKTNKQNTATRVGTAMLEHINKLEQDYYDKTTINNRTSEYNVSINHPTSGISSSNKYDLSSAIAQVPAELRTAGLKVSFLNSAGKPESWEYQGGSWSTGSFSQVGAGEVSKQGIYNVDANIPLSSGFYTSATARNAVPSSVRKLGLIITYKTDATTSVTEQFIGSAVSAWTTDTNWQTVGSEGGNKILEWNTDVATTRKQVPVKERKAGMQISYYHPDKGWINEQYINNNYFNDPNWIVESNWKQIPNQDDLEELKEADSDLKNKDSAFQSFLDSPDEYLENFQKENQFSTKITSFIPSNQNFNKKISRFKITTEGVVGLYLANFHRNENGTFRLRSKYPATWDILNKCYNVEFTYEEGCYVGIVAETKVSFGGRNIEGSFQSYYSDSDTYEDSDVSFKIYQNWEVYFAVNNYQCIDNVYKELDNKADKSFVDIYNEVNIGFDRDSWDDYTVTSNGSSAYYNPNPVESENYLNKVSFYATEQGSIYLAVAYDRTQTVDKNESKIAFDYSPDENNIATIYPKIKLKKGQYVGICYKSGGKLKISGFTSGWYYICEYIVGNPTYGELDDLRSEIEKLNKEKKLKSFLSPAILYADNFATEKTVQEYKDTGTKYEAQDVPAWNDVGSSWTKGIDNETLSYTTPTGNGIENILWPATYYTMDYRSHRYMIKLDGLDTIFCVQAAQINYDTSSGGGEGSVLIKVDFANKKLIAGTVAEKTIPFDFTQGGIYWIEIFVMAFGARLSVVNSIKPEEYCEVYWPVAATPSGYFGIYLESGTPFKLYHYIVTSEGKFCDLYITGDSITKNKGCGYGRWADLIKNDIPSTVISARGTSNYRDMLKRLMYEVDVLRPKILFSANSYNGDGGDKFYALIQEFCKERNIIYLQSMCTDPNNKDYNVRIMKLNVPTVRFDIASRLNFDITQGFDTSKWPDRIHPNVEGCKDLYDRVKMDIPQLLYSFNHLYNKEMLFYQ